MSTLTLQGSDHPHFRAGAKAAAVVERGALVQLARYRVTSVERRDDRIVVTTALEYTFVVAYADYARLVGICETADRIPA